MVYNYDHGLSKLSHEYVNVGQFLLFTFFGGFIAVLSSRFITFYLFLMNEFLIKSSYFIFSLTSSGYLKLSKEIIKPEDAIQSFLRFRCYAKCAFYYAFLRVPSMALIMQKADCGRKKSI